MKIFPIKFMSNYDKMKNLIKIMGTLPENNTRKTQFASKVTKDTFNKTILEVDTNLSRDKNKLLILGDIKNSK